MKLRPISVTILTKNSALFLARTLDSLKAFDEVLVYDTGSIDATVALAKSYRNVRVIEGSFEGFGKTHNEASRLAKHDWILSIDSDEWLSQELASEVLSLKLDPDCVYQLSRRNFFQGKWIWSCGWSPDWQKRLYNRHRTQFSQAKVHEAIESKGLDRHRLKQPLFHEPYRGIEDFLSKMQLYSGLFADQRQDQAKSVSVWTAISHALFTFFKSYVMKLGVLQGYEGYLISIYNAHCALYKYLKLYERSRPQAACPPSHRASDPS